MRRATQAVTTLGLALELARSRVDRRVRLVVRVVQGGRAAVRVVVRAVVRRAVACRCRSFRSPRIKSRFPAN